jgi:ABC-2 type transport system permease protein/oleandomycin transport system permease protein
MTTTEASPPLASDEFAVRDVQPRPVADAITITWRNLLNIRRNPQLLVFATIQPIVFVLMFRYVFGGAITVPGVKHYVDYLMPGIFVQTVVFGSLTTGVGLADDLQKGLIERFRSLPMARSAVLVGRTLADLVRNIFVVLLMSAMGLLVGWRIHTNVVAMLAGLALVVAFAYALSWVFAIVGMLAPDGETAQAASFPLLAPLVFASSAFVGLRSMPGWLQAFASRQPVSIVVNAVRALTFGGPTKTYLIQSIAWIVGIIAVCAPLAVAQYRRSV